MKKLLFGISDLEIGGAEKVLVDIVNSLCSECDIEILTIYSNGVLEKNINSKIKITHMIEKSYNELNYIKRKLFSLKIYSKAFKNQLYKKYDDKDVIISFLEGPITKIFNNINKYKIAWIHTNISKHYDKNKLKFIEQDYEKYNKIVFISQSSKSSFDIVYNNKFASKELVINNYIDKERVIRDSNKEISIKFLEPNFLVVSRLVDAKGIERLINIHSLLLNVGLKHYIYVIGSGPLKEKLEFLIKEKNIEETFILLGQIENPYPYIKASEKILIPSIYEGYGMSAIESKILNKRIISTKTGVVEALNDYENKVICENNETELYKTLKEELENKYIDKKTKKYDFDNSDILEKIKNLMEEK